MNSVGVGAVVFGGASGLGEAAVRRLIADRAQVLIADIDGGRASALAEELGAAAVPCDITDEDAVEAAVATAASLTPRGLRVCVICAGLATPTKLIGQAGPTPLEAFATVLHVNLLGTVNVLRLAAAAMRENEPDGPSGERGICINTASIAAFDGQVGQIAYAASKGGVVGLTLPAARELASIGVRVMTIAPGLFDTPMIAGLPEAVRQILPAAVPFPPRLGDPSEYSALVAHIIENTMLNGETIRLDGALRMQPR